jgi:hypothetical protein
MDADSILDQLQRAEFQRGDATVLAIGLMLTMYLEEAHLPERRMALAACFDEYWDAAETELHWVTQPRPRANGEVRYAWLRDPGRKLLRPAAWVPELSPDHAWSVTALGGESVKDASRFNFEIAAAGAWQKRLSYVTASWPIGFFAQRPETFRAMVRRWIDRTQPLHGYGGLGVLLPLDGPAAGRAVSEAYGLARRFPGLELDAPAHQMRVLADGIKGVNWLTVVADRLLEPLGGPAALRARLDKRFDCYRYDTGLVIQAGDVPALGDAHQGVVPEPYRDLARLLAPIRAHFEHSLMSGLTAEQSAQWLSRFD